MKSIFLHGLKGLFCFEDVKRCRQRKIPPKSILFPIIWVTNNCNLRCKICDKWKTDSAMLSQELSTQDWYSFVDSAKRMQAAVIIVTGGEPLLRPDIFDILEYIRKKEIAYHLCTNGTLVNEDVVKRFKYLTPNSISISIDSSCAQTHNELRGTECFDTIIKGISLLRRNMPKLNIGINYLITRKNFRNLHTMIPFAESLGVNQIKFAPLHTNLSHRHKEIISFENFIFTETDLPELYLEIDKLMRVASRTRLLLTSFRFMEGIPRLYNGQYYRLQCYAGYISCAVDALGRVSPCEEIEGEENLRNKPLEEIWRSSSFQQLREQVHNCSSKCWDTTHTELNIRCSGRRDFGQILREMYFYFR